MIADWTQSPTNDLFSLMQFVDILTPFDYVCQSVSVVRTPSLVLLPCKTQLI